MERDTGNLCTLTTTEYKDLSETSNDYDVSIYSTETNLCPDPIWWVKA